MKTRTSRSIMLAALLAAMAGLAFAKDDEKSSSSTVTIVDPAGALSQHDASARLYAAACAACHYNGAARSDFGAKGPVASRNPDDLLRAILFGKEGDDDEPGVGMPGFGSFLGDVQVAGLAAYLRSTRTANPPWSALEARVAKVRRAGKSE